MRLVGVSLVIQDANDYRQRKKEIAREKTHEPKKGVVEKQKEK